MQKKLTIALDDEIYHGLYQNIGKGKINEFIINLLKPYALDTSLESAYKKMAQDRQREKLANELEDGLVDDDFS